MPLTEGHKISNVKTVKKGEQVHKIDDIKCVDRG